MGPTARYMNKNIGHAKPSASRKAQRQVVGADERALEDFLFGDVQSSLIIDNILQPTRLTENIITPGSLCSVDNDELCEQPGFIIDTKPIEGECDVLDVQEDVGTPSVSSSAWHDEDDDGIAVDLHSQSRLKKMRLDENEISIEGSDYAERLRRRYVI